MDLLLDESFAAAGLVGAEEAEVWPWEGFAVEGGTADGEGMAAAFLLGAMVFVWYGVDKWVWV